MFTPSLQHAARQIYDANHGLLPMAYTATEHAAQIPTYSAQHSLFFEADKKYHFGAIVAAPSFDAELHIETTTIMFADVVESVRLIEQDELGSINRIRALLSHLSVLIVPQHCGELLERRGDGLLLTFPDAPRAAACALAIHHSVELSNADCMVESAITLRIGIHTDSVFTDDHAIYGSGINLAARVAALADAGGTVLSELARSQLAPGLDGVLEDMGDCYVKNVNKPIRLFRLSHSTVSRTAISASPPLMRLRPTIMVLPFEAVGSESDSLKACAVVTDDIVSGLATLRSVSVISRLTTQSLAGRQKLPERLAALVDVDYFVAGSVVCVDGKLSVRFELSDAKTQRVVRSGRQLDSVTALLLGQSEATLAVCAAVCLAVERHEVEKSATNPLPTLQSHCAMLSAVTLMHQNAKSSYERSERLLSVLTERHARHPLPHAWTAKQHMLKTMHGWSGDITEDGQMARQASERSLRTGVTCALALAVRGIVASHIERDYAAATRFYDEAIAVDENESLAWIFKSTLHSFSGEGRDAVLAAEKALALSPLDPLRYYFTSLASSAYLTDGQFDQAISYARESMQLNAAHMSTHRVLVIALAMRGETAQATDAAKRLLKADPNFSVRQFRKNHPGGASEMGRSFAEALMSAGIPN